MKREELKFYIRNEDKKKVAEKYSLTVKSIENVLYGRVRKSPCLPTLIAIAEINRQEAMKEAEELKGY